MIFKKVIGFEKMKNRQKVGVIVTEWEEKGKEMDFLYSPIGIMSFQERGGKNELPLSNAQKKVCIEQSEYEIGLIEHNLWLESAKGKSEKEIFGDQNT